MDLKCQIKGNQRWMGSGAPCPFRLPRMLRWGGAAHAGKTTHSVARWAFAENSRCVTEEFNPSPQQKLELGMRDRKYTQTTLVSNGANLGDIPRRAIRFLRMSCQQKCCQPGLKGAEPRQRERRSPDSQNAAGRKLTLMLTTSQEAHLVHRESPTSSAR